MWITLRRGLFQVAEGAVDPAGTAAIRAALAAHANRSLIVSHASAAMLHGLPEPLGGWGPPSFTSTSGSVRLGRDLHIYVADIDRSDEAVRHGLPVTSLARTVADCLRHLSGPNGIATADGGLRHGLDSEAVHQVLKRQGGWPGIVRARHVMEIADGRRESPLESWSALALHERGMPPPAWQVEIRDPTGAFVGRVDCWWEAGLAGEADGRSKYALAAAERGGANARRLGEVLADERSRENGLRRNEIEEARWGAHDVLRPTKADDLTTYLRTQLSARLCRPAFRGTAHQPPFIPTRTTSEGLFPRPGR